MEHWIPLGGHNYQTKIFILIILLWGLWNVRNKIAIERKFPGSSHDVFVKIFKFLQKWRILLREKEAQFVEEHLGVLKKVAG